MRIFLPMFTRYTNLRFSFRAVSFSDFDIRLILASYNEFENVPSYILGEFKKDWYEVYFKCLVKFTSEAIWFTAVLFIRA